MMLRVDAIAVRVLVQGALACGFTLAVLVVMHVWAITVDAGLPDNPRAVALAAVLAGLVLPVALGAWLTAGFAHLPLMRVWIGWTIWILGWWAAVLLVRAAVVFMEPDLHSVPPSERSLMMLFESAPAVIALFLMMLVSSAGIPIGRLLLRMAGAFRAWRWRLRMRMRRAARQSR